ncbi:MAG: HEAT repeat domain-containing protein, partial [Gammaproteobacteria bacterium]|nr:HEAT repeat domain-containing protein [Gammaproteobacteria bacterium]
LVEAWGTIKADPAHLYAWALGNANPDIRMQGIWLVGQRGDRAYLERIAPMLKDADSGVRGMAAWAIVRILGAEYGRGLET